MDKVIVAVGSTRRPKLNAVWEALTVFAPMLDPDAQFDVVGVEVASGVAHTPLSRTEMMRGARARADALVRIAHDKHEVWRYFVGLEGGFEVVKDGRARHVFLQNWAYVSDGDRGAYGQSGSIQVPEPLAARVVDEGIELAEGIDAFAGQQGIRDAQGAWGIFTKNIITRQDAFRVAVINAFAPFFNQSIYAVR